MAKIPIKRSDTPTPPAADTCFSCKYRDPNMLEGATKVMCMRYPRREHMRVTDWCGEFTQLVQFSVNVKEGA